MSLFRNPRNPSLFRSLAFTRPTSIRPAVTRYVRTAPKSDYGSGTGDSVGEDGGNKQQQQPSSSSSSQPSGSSAKKSGGPSTQDAQPKILNASPPKDHEASEEVKEHNEQLRQRAERPAETVNDEDVEKDKVHKGFWSGTGERDKES